LSGLFLLRALVFVLVLSSVNSAGAQNKQEGLLNGAREFANLVEIKDAQGVMNEISDQGTSFIGTAYTPIKVDLSRDEIRKDFETKTGVYCLFFDTRCFQEEDARERSRRNGRALVFHLRSIADLLATAKEKRFAAYDNLTNGKVTLLLSGRTSETARLGEDAVNFYFRFERGQWKLRNVEYN
jgi:hypothetical protein